MKAIHVQIGITIIAIVGIIVHLAWPNLAIDGITLVFILLTVTPWLAPLFKSVEFPGGWKIEFQELHKVKEQADRAGLLAPPSEINKTPEFSFQSVANDDPNLALAGLRIEIERRLQKLAESHGISVSKQGVGSLMRILSKQEILSPQEYSVLADMVGLLNSAVHGATVDKRALEWAMDVGPRLLKSLDDKAG